MSCCLTSDALSFPLNLQYNSLPIEKTARVPYSPQLMYLILPFFTLLFYMELLKCHSIFVRFFISSNKFVDPSIVIFKPTGYFPSSSCHLNCRRFSTLDELLFYKVIMLARSQLLEELIFKLFPSKETITSLSIGKNSVYLPE